MTLLQNSISVPDLDISSSSANDDTISTEQLTPSLCNGFKPNLTAAHPHFTVASPYASHPTNALPSMAVPGAVSPSTYLQSLTTSTATPLNDSMVPPHLRNSELFSVAPSLRSANSATSSSWVYRRAEELQGVRCAMPTSDLPPITAGDQGASPVVQYPPTFSNTFSDTIVDAWPTPPGFVLTPSHTAQEYSVNEMSSETMQDDREHAQRIADSCKEDAKGVFVLSALLSAIVATFLLDSYKMLPPGDRGDDLPATSIVCVQIMWLISFVLGITSTLFATLALPWVRRFAQLHRNPNMSRDRTHTRLFSCCATLRYDIRRAVSMIVMSLHASLFLFLVGLVVFYFTINKLVAIVLSMVVGLFGMIYLIMTILACVNRDCPYHTPMSGAWWSQREHT